MTITIREGVRWSDGEPLKIEDLILPYEIIAHPDYTGVRYDTEFKNIIGVEEYHEGKAKTISGIRKIDEPHIGNPIQKVVACDIFRRGRTVDLCGTQPSAERHSCQEVN